MQIFTRIKILDCYTDPLGWKDGLGECESDPKLLHEASHMACFCKNVKNVENLFSTVTELGKGVISCLLGFNNFQSEMSVLPPNSSWKLIYWQYWVSAYACRIGWTRQSSILCCNRLGKSAPHN